MNAVMQPQQPPAQTALAPLEALKRSLWPQIKSLVPNDENMAKSLFATAVRLASDPKIMACTQKSIINCFTRAIDLGLSLDPAFGEAYFIPYKDYKDNSVTELTVQLGAKGYAALAQKLGGWQIQIIPVFDCDTYEVTNTFKHGWMENETRLEFNKPEREANIHNQDWCHEHLRVVIANARRKENGEWVVISLEPAISKNEVERRRLMSSNQKANKYSKPEVKVRLEKGLPIGVWQEHYLAMAEKTALAALARKLPKNRGTEKLLETINDNSIIDSTATVIETPQAPLPPPPTPEPVPETVPETIGTIPFETVTNSLEPEPKPEYAEFTESTDDNVDKETGEVLNPELPAGDAIAQPVYAGKKLMARTIEQCTTNNMLVAFWETVPDAVKSEFQEAFEARQDVLRFGDGE